MSFGSDMGTFLTASDEFSGDLIYEGGQTVALTFDSFKLIYKEGSYCHIRLGLLDNQGTKNELKLDAGQLVLRAGMTYPIGPQLLPIQATFSWGDYINYLPQSYWGNLAVNRFTTDGAETALIEASFSLGWETDAGSGVEVQCTLLRVST